jgi:hypothetical protein
MRMLAEKYGSSAGGGASAGERKPAASSATEKDTMLLGRRY